VPIGNWVLREACRQAREWQQRWPSEPPLAVSVNLSVKRLQQPTFPQDVARSLYETGLDPGSLCLEVTESVAMDDTHSTLSTLQTLKALGVRIAIDDFGAGYAALSYLQTFPVNALKIDRSFVEKLGHDLRSASIVSTIISFARTLGLSIIAEGIENPEQLAQLVELGCPLGQGFYFSEPLPSEEAEQLIFSGHLG
jgi:EAL domain-containing protein (putative c-di-GMP-specific phosphodiesterase class I)